MKHLFLLMPPRSGSTLMSTYLKRCKNVASMARDEGQEYFGDWPRFNDCYAPTSMRHGFSSRNTGYYSNPNNYSWSTIKEQWDIAWNKKDDDRVYLEKSPPNVWRWEMLQENFRNTYFIAVIRNPYTQVETWTRHFGNTHYDACGHLALDWLKFAHKTKQAINNSRNIIYFTFEEWMNNPIKTAEIIKERIPELHDLDFTQSVRLSNKSVSKLKSNHQESLNRLNIHQIFAITQVLIGKNCGYERKMSTDKRYETLKFWKPQLVHTSLENISEDEIVKLVTNIGSLRYGITDKRFSNTRFITFMENDTEPSEWMKYFGLVEEICKTIFFTGWR